MRTVVYVAGLLNEVLSLNAQESCGRIRPRRRSPLLNEVLSLNAQEFKMNLIKTKILLSSMKS